jgi:hypothetical protein
MTTPGAGTSPPARRLGRSAAAVLAGFVAVVVLSLGTDQVLHVLQIYQPWGQPMRDPGLNLLALGYRCVYGVFGSYLMARLAPYAPMRHVWVGAAIGFVLSSVGAIGAIRMDLGPVWYPIALAFSAWPTAWLGGTLHLRQQAHATRAGNPQPR